MGKGVSFTLHRAGFTLHSVGFTLLSVGFTLHNVESTLHGVESTLHGVSFHSPSARSSSPRHFFAGQRTLFVCCSHTQEAANVCRIPVKP
jgi:hypothetical protein